MFTGIIGFILGLAIGGLGGVFIYPLINKPKA